MRLECPGQLLRVRQKPLDILAWVGEPTQINDDTGDWVCACGISGLSGIGDEARVRGVRPMQAVLLAYRRLRALLEREVRLGATLTIPGEPEPVDLALFFGDTE